MSQSSVLKHRRQELNMTQVEVAMAAGVSQPTYYNYEAGTIAIPPGNLKRLAKALKLSKEEILGSPKVVVLPPPVKPRAPAKHCDERGEDDSHPDNYGGNVAIHFEKGEPIVLAISEDEHCRLYSVVQEDQDFFSVYSMSNQIVGVRRAAVTDLSFAEEAGGTFGLEHDYYKENDLVTGVWPGTDQTWHIIEVLTSMDDGYEIPAIVDRYGRARIDRIAEKFGIDILENVREPVAGKKVEAGHHQYTEKAIAKATALACNVKWQLSNGKVRQVSMLYREQLVRFGWMTESAASEDTLFDVDDNMSCWINPDTVDYISIPAHIFLDESKRATDARQMALAKSKKKRGNV
jgi:transcriptional regulator with XRE-family HTH domain